MSLSGRRTFVYQACKPQPFALLTSDFRDARGKLRVTRNQSQRLLTLKTWCGCRLRRFIPRERSRSGIVLIIKLSNYKELLCGEKKSTERMIFVFIIFFPVSKQIGSSLLIDPHLIAISLERIKYLIIPKGAFQINQTIALREVRE